MSKHRGLEVLAIAGHGAAILIHLLGAIWNRIVAETWFDRDVAVHAGAGAFSVWSLIKHVRRARG